MRNLNNLHTVSFLYTDPYSFTSFTNFKSPYVLKLKQQSGRRTRSVVKHAPPSSCETRVGNLVEKEKATERYNHFLKSERERAREQATHVEVDHDTDST